MRSGQQVLARAGKSRQEPIPDPEETGTGANSGAAPSSRIDRSTLFPPPGGGSPPTSSCVYPCLPVSTASHGPASIKQSAEQRHGRSGSIVHARCIVSQYDNHL